MLIISADSYACRLSSSSSTRFSRSEHAWLPGAHPAEIEEKKAHFAVFAEGCDAPFSTRSPILIAQFYILKTRRTSRSSCRR
jgi:hypothetical protein